MSAACRSLFFSSSPLSALALALGLVPGLASCDAPAGRTVTIDLEGRVGDARFECGGEYPGVGATATTLTALDFRFYVHSVVLTTDDGREVPLELSDDGVWQNGGIALIDFEDGDGCEGGNAPTNARLVGTVPADVGAISGLRFVVGVPEARNHLDSATAPSPLNLSSMYWGWQAGYKYLRFEGRTTGQPAGMRVHIGATGCSGDPRAGTRTCAERNEIPVALDGFDPDSQIVVADLAAMFDGIDLDVNAGGPPGCMADESDPDCAAIFDALGIATGSTQRLFRAEARE